MTDDAADASAPNSPRPLYGQVRDALRDAIARGDYAVGTLLPTEAELCTTFAASRHTVREALRRLVDLGLIERRQGAGSRVVAATPPVAFVHTARSLSELWSYTRATKIIVEESAIVALDTTEAAIVDAPVASRWRRIRASRWTANESDMVCYLTLYAHARFAGILEDLGQSTDPVYAIIEARTGERVTEAVQEISAREMPADAAQSLDVRPGSSALQIIRRYLGADARAMLVALSLHPAETFTHTLRLRREVEPDEA